MSALKFKYENLREDRLQFQKAEATFRVDQRNYEIVDANRFGLAILFEGSYSRKFEYLEGDFEFLGQQVTHTKLMFVREYDSEIEGKKIIAFTVVGDPIDIDDVKSIQFAQKVSLLHKAKLEHFQSIDSSIWNEVSQMCDWLDSFKFIVKETVSQDSNWVNSQFVFGENQMTLSISKYIEAQLSPAFERIESKLSEMDQSEVMLALEYFSHRILPYLGLFNGLLPSEIHSVENAHSQFRELRKERIFTSSLYQFLVKDTHQASSLERANFLYEALLAKVMKARDVGLQILLSPGKSYVDFLKIVEDPIKSLDGSYAFQLADHDESLLMDAYVKYRKVSNMSKNDFNMQFLRENIHEALIKMKGRTSFDIIYFPDILSEMEIFVAERLITEAISLLNSGGRIIVSYNQLHGKNFLQKYLSFSKQVQIKQPNIYQEFIALLEKNIIVDQKETDYNSYLILKNEK